MENDIEIIRYNYVEFASMKMSGFRNRIIDIREVQQLAMHHDHFEAFTSMYLYREDILKYIRNHRIRGKPSVSGYDGPVYSHFLHFDIDSDDLTKAQEMAQKLVSFFYDKWGVDKYGTAIAFTGNRGFHIALNRMVFGETNPSKQLNRIHAGIRKVIPGLAGIADEALIDQSISDKTRLWRLLGTKHSRTGLYKIQLHPYELFSLSAESIIEKAGSPQRPVYTDETGLIPLRSVRTVPAAEKLYQKAIVEVMTGQNYYRVENDKISIDDARDIREVLCEAGCILMKTHVEEGQRNNAAVLLSSSLRTGGYSKQKSWNILVNWNKTNLIELSCKELISVIDSAYCNGRAYHFGCNRFKLYCPYKNREKCERYRLFKRSSLNKHKGSCA
ncbi:hypothetical protein MUP95_09535 [bacterium]|nr:hypothetical protein [bacterium]